MKQVMVDWLEKEDGSHISENQLSDLLKVAISFDQARMILATHKLKYKNYTPRTCDSLLQLQLERKEIAELLRNDKTFSNI